MLVFGVMFKRRDEAEEDIHIADTSGGGSNGLQALEEIDTAGFLVELKCPDDGLDTARLRAKGVNVLRNGKPGKILEDLAQFSKGLFNGRQLEGHLNMIAAKIARLPSMWFG